MVMYKNNFFLLRKKNSNNIIKLLSLFLTLGTRLDYILVNEDLTKWFKSCNVEQDIMGSDHCPVFCELFDEINDYYEGIINEKVDSIKLERH